MLSDLLTPLLRQQVRRALLGRTGTIAGTAAALDGARRHLGVAERRLSGQGSALSRLEAERALLSGPFSPQMTVDQAWRRHPAAGQVFARHHLPGCQSCAVRFDETIAEAADAYGLPLDALLTQLNALL